MGYANDMTLLIEKLERRLGTRQLNLPDFLQKNKWVEVIKGDTLPTFSRYFPNKIRYLVTQSDKKGDYYLIDENKIGDVKILGIKDLSWDDPTFSGQMMGTQFGGMYDYFSVGYGLEDIAIMQMGADQASLFNNGIYLDFVSPNKIKLNSCVNQINIPQFPVDVFIEHISINTIAPTKMEIFEKLAKADVAGFLYNELKYYDNMETVFATVDIKLSDLQDIANTREDIIQILQDSYVSMANDNQCLMYTV